MSLHRRHCSGDDFLSSFQSISTVHRVRKAWKSTVSQSYEELVSGKISEFQSMLHVGEVSHLGAIQDLIHTGNMLRIHPICTNSLDCDSSSVFSSCKGEILVF